MQLIPNIPRVLQVFNATVKMGTDGTDDDVTVGICSDSKTDCCEKKLNQALTDNWKKNKVRLAMLLRYVQGWAKDWSLGCVNPDFLTPSGHRARVHAT